MGFSTSAAALPNKRSHKHTPHPKTLTRPSSTQPSLPAPPLNRPNPISTPQDSNDDGAGYETAIKGEGGVAAKPKKSGTTKKKAGK